jgi:predicted Zn-dependent protease
VKLENPPQADQYDPEAEQPLRELAILLGGVLALSLVAVLVLAYFAGMLAPRLPFSVERDFMAERMTADPRFTAQAAELQRLADRIGTALALPPEMKLTLHYSDDMTVNAYATLGGHVVVFRGLISRVDSENALAAVIAHEIAHVRHRHPATAAGRGIAIGLAISMLSSTVGNTVAQRVMGTTGMGVLLNYSREQETAADEDALRAVAAVYGHLGGAADLFETLKKAHPDSEGGLELFRSHPYSDRRIEHVREFAARHGIAADGARTPLMLPLPKPTDQPLPRLF